MASMDLRPDSHGKVRDIYDCGDSLLMVASDRISAFDFILPDEVPHKGEILSRISAFWFEKFSDIIPNHLVSMDPADYPAEYAQYSDYPIDPYANTDGDGFVPAGDTFQVYPGADGQPEESIRMAVTTQAMQDLRAFEWLGELVGRDAVKAMIDEGLAEPVTFSRFPRSQDYLINLRRRVNRAILDAAK